MGGDSGIGRAVALAFAREGADLLISYLSEHEDAEETKRRIGDAGRKAILNTIFTRVLNLRGIVAHDDSVSFLSSRGAAKALI